MTSSSCSGRRIVRFGVFGQLPGAAYLDRSLVVWQVLLLALL